MYCLCSFSFVVWDLDLHLSKYIWGRWKGLSNANEYFCFFKKKIVFFSLEDRDKILWTTKGVDKSFSILIQKNTKNSFEEIKKGMKRRKTKRKITEMVPDLTYMLCLNQKKRNDISLRFAIVRRSFLSQLFLFVSFFNLINWCDSEWKTQILWFNFDSVLEIPYSDSDSSSTVHVCMCMQSNAACLSNKMLILNKCELWLITQHTLEKLKMKKIPAEEKWLHEYLRRKRK